MAKIYSFETYRTGKYVYGSVKTYREILKIVDKLKRKEIENSKLNSDYRGSDSIWLPDPNLPRS